MNGFIEWLTQVINAIGAFLNWYVEDTPLLEDTLDSFYALGVQAYNILYPLIGEYIEYISEYIKGVGA